MQMKKETFPLSIVSRNIAAGAVCCLSALLLSGCGSDMATKRRPASHSIKPASPAPRYSTHSQEYRQCTVKLASLNARYSPLPDRNYGSGCSSYGAVKLDYASVPISNLGAMTCPLAENFAAWARYGVAPAARLILGSDLIKIETMGTQLARQMVK